MGNKNKKTPVISAGLTKNDFDCQLCGENAWRGPKCKDCKLFERAHYTEGVGGVPPKVDFFCVANSPFLSGPSSSLVNHQGWTKDIEKIVRAAFLRTININNVFKSFVGRFTYAVRCERKKPLKNNIDCCAPLFHEELLTYSNPKRPIMIFAMGDSVLKALGLKIRKYSKAQEHFITTTLQGRKVYIYVSMSKQQLAAKTGYFDLFKNHMDLFLSGVVDVNKGKAIQITPTLDMLSKHYVFPKTLKEVEKLVDHILAYSENDVNPDNWIISLDTETNTKYPHRKNLKLLSLIVSWATGYATSIPIEHPGTPWTFEQVAPQIQRLLSCPKPKVLQNAKFDLKVLKRKGWDIRRIGWDTMLGEHLLVEDKKGFYGLKDLTNIMLPAYSGYEDTLQAILTSAEGDSQIAEAKQSVEKKKKEKLKGAAKKLAKDAETEGFLKVPLDDLNLYGAIDGDVTRQIVALQRARVGQENKALAKRRSQWANNAYFKHLAQPGCSLKDPILSNMFGRVLPTTRVLADMELYGMRVDRDYVDELTVKMELSLQKSQGEMLPMVPENISFNPSSAHDVRKLLYGTGFKHPETGEIICYEGVVEPQRTETGLASTNAQFLRSLATQYDCPLSNAILRYRATHKALTTFVANIKALSEEDGRMYTNFHQHGTATFRLCVSENTILDTDKGSFIISQLNLSKIQNISILTHRGRMRSIRNVFYKGKEEMYCVELENGSKIEVTKNHRFHTPQGFKHLMALSVGNYVTTVRSDNITRTRGINSQRKRLCNSLSRKIFTYPRVSRTRNILQNTVQFGTVFQEKIFQGDKSTTTSYVFGSPERKCTRKKRISNYCNSQRQIRTTLEKGIFCSENGKPFKNKCLVYPTKYEALQSSKNRNTPISYARYRPGISPRIRAIRSRTVRKCTPVLRRSSRILQKIVPSIFSSNRTHLVCKRTSKGIFTVASKRKNIKRAYLLESKSPRINSFDRIISRQDSTHTTVPILQKIHGRFWFPILPPISRNQREFSSLSCNQKTRQNSESSCQAFRVPAIKFYNKRNRRKSPRSSQSNTFGTSQIKSIRSIGIKGVWDVEVEEDHSYVAQGFVNHNSSSDENMQNVPYQIGEHNIKKSFIPTDPENQVICNADAKAAEVRIYAAYSKDCNLIQALNDGMDPHSFFAGMIFKPEIILAEIEYASQKAVMNLIGIDEEHNWNYDDFNNRANFKDTDPWYAAQLEKLRKTIKRVVFGILYGASKYKIAQIVGISLEQAQTIIDALEKMFPSIPEYVRTTKDQVRNIGVIETFLGRRRRFDLQGLTNYGRSKANRQAINFKIQSTSSDIVLEVLCDVAEPIRQDFGGHLLITVHDSIVAEIPKKYISQLPDFFKEHGQNNVGIRHPWLPVPFKWDVEVGTSYGEVIDVYDYMNKNDIERIDPDEYLEQEIRADFEKELAIR